MFFVWESLHPATTLLQYFYRLKNVILTLNIKTCFLRNTKYVSSYIRTWCNKVHCILVILIPNQVVTLLQGLQHHEMQYILWKLKVNASSVISKQTVPGKGSQSVSTGNRQITSTIYQIHHRLSHRIRKHLAGSPTCPDSCVTPSQEADLDLPNTLAWPFANFNLDDDLHIQEPIQPAYTILLCYCSISTDGQETALTVSQQDRTPQDDTDYMDQELNSSMTAYSRHLES